QQTNTHKCFFFPPFKVSKSKQHAISASSEEKHDPRGHHARRYHQDHVDSQSQEHLQQLQNDLASLQQTHYSSEENADVPEQPSHEAVDDDDDDNNDSNDTDESDEVITDFPTEAPVTPFNRGDNAGRGDSVAYGFRAKAHVVKASKLHKAAKKDSRELAQHPSVENDSRPRFDSPEVDGGDSKASAGMDSTESQGSVPAVDTSNQTLESAEDAEDRHSIENNEVTR
ncbi:UNVERIFIED_CONTAM: hypothetical protein H355_012236, partial [Colinus virginianus]